ncbi:NVEALA domain-containing protein [Bacteroides caccae]|uniref:NVEALA domain-containing protein n=1 Tax=Bacteroides caccae TaxID=47678 RepID=UPI0032EB0AA2
MKKGIFMALLFTVIVALYSLYLANGKCVYKSNISSLLLENIEALAADEDGSDDGEVVGGKIRCIDVGSLDCPLTHEKVKYIVRGYSL